MKTLVFPVLALLVTLWSCSPSGENVAPAAQSSLALVVPSNVSGSNANLLLLSDGRTALPASGMPGFNQLRVGEKLSLLFNAGSLRNGVLTIDVKSFSSSHDTTHIPGPHHGHDSTTLTGKFSGVVYRSKPDSSLTDSTSYRSKVTVIFHGSKYTCPPSPGGYPAAGEGTFVLSNNTITFTDKNTSSDAVLNGRFYYSMYQENLYLWKFEGGVYTSYSITRGNH